MATAQRVLQGLRAVLVADGMRLLSKGLVILLLTRVLLEPGEYGLLFLAMSVLAVALLFSRLGLEKSAARFVAEYNETDPGQVPHILKTALAYVVVATVVVVGVLTLASDWIAGVLGEAGLAPLLVLGGGYIVGRTMVSFSTIQFQGFNRVAWSAVVRAIESVCTPLFVVAFVLFGLGAAGALLGYVVSAALAGGVGMVLLYLKFFRPRESDDGIESGLPRRILKYSIPLAATRGSNVVDKRVDILLIGYFMAPAAVGFYTLGKQISEFVIAPAASLGFTVSPAYGEQKAKDDLDAAARMYELTLAHTVALYVPAAAGLIIVADPAIRFIFGAEYIGTVPVVQVLSGLVVVQSIDKITNDGLDYLGRARDRAIAKGGAAATNFGLNVLLIPLFGIVGAAAATVFSYSMLVVVELYIVHRELAIDVRRLARSAGVVCLITAGMSAIVLALAPYISGVASLFGVVLAGVVVWAALATASGVLDVQQIRSALS